MRSPTRPTGALAALCCALAALLLSPALSAAAPSHPLLLTIFNFPNENARPRVNQYFEGPCGVTVRPDGGIYVSDYYHDRVESFGPDGAYLGDAITGFDPVDGPCGLAADAGDGLFVNDFHRSVSRYAALGSPQLIDSAEPTGVAYDPAADRVYVDDRTSVSVYEDSGAPVETGGEPLRIGVGEIGDGYGVAVSDHPGQEGFVYVADAAAGTIKVFDPATDPSAAVTEIDGADLPGGGFATLRDAALAIDQASGNLFVVYNAEGPFYEHPKAAVAEFDPSGAYLGALSGTPLRFGEPSGIAVDNSGGATQGRVFVTSGNSEVQEPKTATQAGRPEEGAVFVFGPAGPGVDAAVSPADAGPNGPGPVDPGPVGGEPAGTSCAGACPAPAPAAVAVSAAGSQAAPPAVASRPASRTRSVTRHHRQRRVRGLRHPHRREHRHGKHPRRKR